LCPEEAIEIAALLVTELVSNRCSMLAPTSC